MLVRLLYASRPAQGHEPAVLDAILEQSRQHNPVHGISGILCFSQSLFMQVLEGGRDEVCELFNRIVRDDRHQHVRLLCYDEIRERRFANWTMGQVDIEKVNVTLLLRYAEKPQLDPYACSGRTSMRLLEELIATGSVVTRDH